VNGSFSKYKIISYLKVKEGRIRRSKSRDLPARIIPGRDYTGIHTESLKIEARSEPLDPMRVCGGAQPCFHCIVNVTCRSWYIVFWLIVIKKNNNRENTYITVKI